MTWVKAPAPAHRCALPERDLFDGVKTGDIWVCDDPGCPARYQVKIEYADQREPGPPWFAWTRLVDVPPSQRS